MLHLLLASLRIECGKCSGYFGYQHQQKNARPPADQIADLDEKIKVGAWDLACVAASATTRMLRVSIQCMTPATHLVMSAHNAIAFSIDVVCLCCMCLYLTGSHRSIGLQVARERLTYLTRRKQHKAKREQQKRVNVLEDRRQV